MSHSIDINILLDRSGSMQTIKTDMEGALKNFVAEQLVQFYASDTRVSLYQFNDHFERVFTEQRLENAKNISLSPMGSTALLDSLARVINETDERLSNKGVQKVIFVVITDGQENASREFSRESVRALIERKRSERDWQFLFLGANQDAFAEAAGLGICRTSALNYAADAAGISLMSASLTRGVTSYASGATASCNLNDDANNA